MRTKKISKVLAGGLIKLEISTEDWENPDLGVITREVEAQVYHRDYRYTHGKWFAANKIILLMETFVYPIRKNGKPFLFSTVNKGDIVNDIKCRNLKDARKRANIWLMNEYRKIKHRVS